MYVMYVRPKGLSPQMAVIMTIFYGAVAPFWRWSQVWQLDGLLGALRNQAVVLQLGRWFFEKRRCVFLGQVGKIEELETGSRFFLDSTGTGFEVARTQVMTNVVQCNLFQGFSGLQEVGSRQENFGVRRINVEASTGRTICDPYSPVFIQRHTWVTNNYSIW